MKRAIALFGPGLAVLMIAACSEGQEGEMRLPRVPILQSPSSLESGSGLPHSGAPAVVDPLPESVLSDHPCEILTPEQVRQALGPRASEGERKDLNAVGPGCGWSSQENLGGFQIGFNTVSREGLSATYANAKPRSGVFRELGSIHDFPAVAYKDSEDDRICTVVVGVANEYSITATVGLSVAAESANTDSCVPAEKVAEVVVGNLKAKAGR
ncbi:DUF3558 domain-containing protein [Saccharomonospora xinjiangensis]|uniref:DUF3558 domain-containing protein n=1 Tax=Saccharomonospora xinjiangensis TaxID=75294 RepID=UPI0035108312